MVKFDETSGTVTDDSSGNGNQVLIMDRLGRRWIGGALSFDGLDRVKFNGNSR